LAVEGLPVEPIYGDLRDVDSVRRAVAGTTRVFHCAAQVSTQYGTAKLKRDIFDSNILGTAHLLQAALEQGVKRVVVTGSFSATGYNPDRPSEPAREDQPVFPFDRALPYEISKAYVEQEALKAYANGLDVVVATSCAIIGPHDYKPSRMGKTLCDFAQGRMPAYIPGGFEFVAARDIVAGHRLAMQKGRSGQKYVFSTAYVTVDMLMDDFESVTGHRKPLLRLPRGVMQVFAEIGAPVVDRIPSLNPRLTPGAVRILGLQRRADISKAREELGYRPTRLRDAIQEAYDDFARRGILPRRNPSHPSPSCANAAQAPAENRSMPVQSNGKIDAPAARESSTARGPY
ncbi:MAG: NAD-dependent epimerase/dehydratase family protein, partial [Myxococcota bacterium]